jgi:hypothetical protein
MKTRETVAQTLDSLDCRGLLDLMAWQRAQDAMAAARPGEVWGKHRHAALQHSHLYQRGDEHVHEGEERLGPAVEVEGTQTRQDGFPRAGVAY